MIATRVVVLARGLGTRMRATDASVELPPEQHAAAGAGLKALMPIGGRPFLDYLLHAIADAGLREVAIVVAPAHEPVREYYGGAGRPSRLRLDLVVQPVPDGTAGAVLAAERWTGGEPFLVVNGDNLYPARAMRALSTIDGPGLAAFPRDVLIASGNVPAGRLRAFARVDVSAGGWLASVVEKPDDGAGEPALVSMNCWRFDSRIFEACREVERSPRGELELPAAVTLAIARGVRFRVLVADEGVLDLSSRADVAAVERRLAGTVPRT